MKPVKHEVRAIAGRQIHYISISFRNSMYVRVSRQIDAHRVRNTRPIQRFLERELRGRSRGGLLR